MKRLGIIGGFGPETTAQFQLAVIDRCRAMGSPIRPEILMWNAPVPLLIEENLILHNSDLEKFLPFLLQGAKTLEKAGAQSLVLPCNTLHAFIKEIRSEVSIPILSIIDTTIEHLVNRKIKRIAIFGTKATTEKNLFVTKLVASGITPILPNLQEQLAIDQVIFDILNNKAHRRSTRILRTLANGCRERGAEDILLACTDLQIVFPKLKEAGVHDTMHILADACVHEILK